MYGPRQFLCGLYGFVVKSGAEAEAWVWTLEDSTQGPEDLEQGRRFRCSFGSGVALRSKNIMKDPLTASAALGCRSEPELTTSNPKAQVANLEPHTTLHLKP